MREKESLNLSIVMPCLNEAATVGICVGDARTFLRENHISGEVIVVDNASVDGSAAIAEDHGARVLREPRKGYGNALRTGIACSRGSVIIIGDCDTTYDFLHLEEMYQLLRKECDMVIGNRFSGGMEKSSMSLSHRWGVKFLSWLGRKRFHTDVYDFHCGLRGLTRQAAERLDLQTEGMEFAAEIIALAAGQGLRVGQVPVSLRRCPETRKSKLRTIPDGLRHLGYILLNPQKRGENYGK